VAKRVELSREARADLKEIGRFTERRWGRQQRIKYLGEIRQRAVALAENHGLGRRRDEISKGLFSASIGSHIILFRVITTGIFVSRVLHARMDIERYL